MIDVASLDVVPYPHPALRWTAKPVPKVTPLVQDVVKKMIELMHEWKGVGLAATQVAIPWRIFVTYVNEKELVFINPEVHLGRNKRDTTPRWVGEPEGCLSFPGLHIEEPVVRSRDVYVSALDIDGKPFTIAGPGLLARVVQHENDHLDGKLFIDRLKLEGVLHFADNKVLLKDYVEGWLGYLRTQYTYQTPPKSGKPKFGTDEEEKEKLLKLESLLLEMPA